MKKYFLFVCLIMLISFNSCNFDSKEIIELRNELRFLETEIASIKGAPGYLFGQAFDYIDAEDYSEAVKYLEELQYDFPDWNKEIVVKYLNQYSAYKSDSLDN